MADNETIADIIAEMRAREDLDGGDMVDNFDIYSGEYGGWDALMLIKAYADRLDAAHKREADYAREAYESALKAEREALREQYEAGALVDGTRGDCAKLREVVKHIKDRLPHMLQYMRVHWEDASAGGYFDELMLAIDAALAAPPRNCDLARDWVCDLYAHFQPPASIKREMPPEWVDAIMAFCRWLVAPATEKEGGAK